MFLDPERYWEPLCRNVGRPDLLDDARFATAADRVENGALLIDELDAAFAARDWADWKPVFDAWDAPWELVKTMHEVAADPQAEANGYLFDVEVADGTKISLAAGPVGFDGQCAPVEPRRAPHLGEHTDEVLARAGVPATELERLRAAAVIQ
jgi:crotonobetainyl-CoA:carnitine CoA-transferase CaiB-like acyl-CoA transferase